MCGGVMVCDARAGNGRSGDLGDGSRDRDLGVALSIAEFVSGFKDDSLRIMKAIVRDSPECQRLIAGGRGLKWFAGDLAVAVTRADGNQCVEINLSIDKVLLFSATFDDAVRAFVSKIVKDLFRGDYNQMFVNKEELSLESVKQYKVKCPDELSKIMVIKDKIFELGNKLGQTIIFVRTRNSASMLHKALTEYGYEVTTIQDLLARGFDQSMVNLVVNFDLPVKHDYPSEPD
ncbi:hypothetical protein C3L33_12363, partial [Rhododendron williamsianum]